MHRVMGQTAAWARYRPYSVKALEELLTAWRREALLRCGELAKTYQRREPTLTSITSTAIYDADCPPIGLVVDRRDYISQSGEAIFDDEV